MNNNENDSLLSKLAKCYFKGSLNFSLQPEDVEKMTWVWQQKFLDTTVNSKRLKLYPVSREYSKLFFKKILNFLQNAEIHDDIYLHLCQSMNEDSNGNSYCYRHHVIGNGLDEIITIKETNKMVIDGTTGMHTWEAALMLADWALINKDIFYRKNILELGSGVGFTGVTIAKHCSPQSIYMTDCHSGVLKTICDNIRINFPTIHEEEKNDKTVFCNMDTKIVTMILDWNAIENLSSLESMPDVIIGADIVYDPTIIQPLCDVLKFYFDSNKELNVFIASVIRNEKTFASFLNALDAMNFTYKKLALDQNGFIDWDQSIDRCLLQINSY